MDTSPTSSIIIEQIYNELQRRIQHISIALLKQRRHQIAFAEEYDYTQTGAPKVGETEYAFSTWNCAILTAFRNVKGLSEDENLKRNLKRNEELKSHLIQDELLFRSVPGRYKEAHWETYVEEMCFFVTNIDSCGIERSSSDQIKDFFRKIYLLAEYYEQDCFLFTFPGANRVAFLIATNKKARNEFRGDIKFAGPLFTHVQEIGDWTQCSDGRISFRLKGMIVRGGTGNKQIKIGEGDIFDIDGYNPTGIIILRGNNQKDLKKSCRQYDGNVPLHEHVLQKEQLTITGVQTAIKQSLDEIITKRKCPRIAFHCSASIGSSFIRGAEISLDTVREWAQENKKRFDEIIIVDIYGEYGRVIAQERAAN